MKTLKLRSFKSVLGFRLAVVALAVVLAGCATSGGGNVNPAVGTWDMTVDSPAGVLPMTLTINADLTGSILLTEPDEASFDITDTAVDGQALTFGVTLEFQGQEIAAKFNGTVDGDAITGEIETDFGNASVEGTRQ
ncbi:MAG TPA: hypothetical protein EYN96_03805 [Candidatus Hydrogenedentes bacterium]|jgi:hypothetical protein|nr:hypothetical protein [Candidatus Hydrogenedentota bacterium]